jgi:molecular chaperone HtpG
MTCNAEKMRKMLDEHNSHKAHYTVDEVLTETVVFSENKAKDTDKHYFKVEMLNIRDVHTELCNLQQVKDYLSFVAPVGYATAFYFRTTLHKHAELLKQPIQEYNVTINGETIKKKYSPSFTTSKGEDKITEVDFHDFRDDKGNLIAWLWFGISRFQGVLKKDNQMRGIRLRSQNIQIGDDNALQKLFNEDRGQHYFVGEVFAIGKDLIPNSQRDYFNENEARLEFERQLSAFFNDDLSRIYKAGSSINSKYDKIEKAELIETEIGTKTAAGESATAEQLAKLERAKKDAESAAQELAKIREKTETKLGGDEFSTVDNVVNKIIESNDEKRANRSTIPMIAAETPSKIQERPTISPNTHTPKQEKFVPLTKVREIIRKMADSPIAEAIIAKIEEELY